MKQIAITAMTVACFGVLCLGLMLNNGCRRENKQADPPETIAVPQNQPTEAKEENEKQEDVVPEKKITPQVIAYYFYAPPRCVTCRKMEAFTQEVIESGFSQDLQNGTLQWRVINYAEAGNERFIEDYGLYTKHLVLVQMVDA